MEDWICEDDEPCAQYDSLDDFLISTALDKPRKHIPIRLLPVIWRRTIRNDLIIPENAKNIEAFFTPALLSAFDYYLIKCAVPRHLVKILFKADRVDLTYCPNRDEVIAEATKLSGRSIISVKDRFYIDE